MAKRFSADQWRAWFLEFDQSDLTVVGFCETIGVSYQSFYKWRKRLKNESVSSLEMGSTPEFVPVTLVPSRLEIEFPGGIVARVANDKHSIRPLIELLVELGVQQ